MPQLSLAPNEPDRSFSLEILPQPAALLSLAGRVSAANAALRELAPAAVGQDLTAALNAQACDTSDLGGSPAYRFSVDGTWRWFRVQRTAISDHAAFAQLIDVTAERLTSDLRDASQMRDRLMQEAEVGTWLYDPDGDLYYFSSELSFGHAEAAEGVPTSILQLVQNPEDGLVDTAIRQRLTTEGGTAEGEMRYRDANGGWKHLRVHYRSGRRTASGRYEMYGISQNVTEQAAAREAALAATAAKSDFLASVSHEIRTPMNGVVGILHLLKNEPLSPEARGMLDEAIGCSAMLGQIIDDVLDFSKMEAGKLDIAPIPSNPVTILDSVAALLRPHAEDKGLYLRTTAEADLGWRDLDPVRLRQCLFNVLGNAAKFTAEGGIEARLSAPAEGRLRVEVEDTGIGIPDAARGSLFDRFQQAEVGTTRKFGGTGLGLAISRRLAQMMGGDMGFSSVEGQGSLFWFEIAAPVVEIGVGASGPDDVPLLDGLRVLVVDDNRVNRLVGVKTLEALGAVAAAVENGTEAIAAIATGAFDLVLMDVNMPGMDGLEATSHIRKSGGPFAGLPIIAMTADVMPHQLTRYAAAGMNGFVPKPFAPTQLLTEIARLVMQGETGAPTNPG